MTNLSTVVDIRDNRTIGGHTDIGILMSVVCENFSTVVDILTTSVSLSTVVDIRILNIKAYRQLSTFMGFVGANVDNCRIRAIYKQKPSSSITTKIYGHPHRACTTVVDIQNGVKNHV